MKTRILTALPVFNEVQHVQNVLEEVQQYCKEILVIDDGSSDGTAELLDKIPGIHVIHHPENLGYGSWLTVSFRLCTRERF